jgi:hypothetical protein
MMQKIKTISGVILCAGVLLVGALEYFDILVK